MKDNSQEPVEPGTMARIYELPVRITYQGNNRGAQFLTCEFTLPSCRQAHLVVRRGHSTTTRGRSEQRTLPLMCHPWNVDAHLQRYTYENAERVRITPSTKSQTTLSAWQEFARMGTTSSMIFSSCRDEYHPSTNDHRCVFSAYGTKSQISILH